MAEHPAEPTEAPVVLLTDEVHLWCRDWTEGLRRFFVTGTDRTLDLIMIFPVAGGSAPWSRQTSQTGWDRFPDTSQLKRPVHTVTSAAPLQRSLLALESEQPTGG
jgi:hypothetical protein